MSTRKGDTSVTTSDARSRATRLGMTDSQPPPSESDALLPHDAPHDASDVAPKSTGQTILDLAIPAAAALLIDPLMTLVDTLFVGRFTVSDAATSEAAWTSASAPLAGMGSAAALLTLSFYLFNFLCTVTTPLVSLQRASGNEAQAIQLGGQVLSLALVLGVALTAVLLIFAEPLLSLMGTSGTGPDSQAYALVFLSVRALAAPAVLCLDAATGIVRGYLDTTTPIVVLVAANVVNLLLDVLLVVLWHWGPLGAAVATTTAEWMAALAFLAVLAGHVKPPWTTPNSRAANNIRIVPTSSIPSWASVQPLVVASSAVLGRALVLQLSLWAAAAMAARSGTGYHGIISGMTGWGVTHGDVVATVTTATTTTAAVAVASSSIAAHQIGIQLWLLCSFFCDSLAAASQGLIADALGRQDPDSVLDVSRTIFRYSLVLGLGLAALLQLGTSTQWLVTLFTSDPLTQAALSRILPLIVVAQPLNALVFAADGVLQGAAEFSFQARAMALSGLSAVATFVALDVASDMGVGANHGDTLVHIWLALIALQAMRGVTSLWKLIDAQGPVNLLALDPRQETM